MRELYEFRIPESWASKVLPGSAGVVLGGSVRKVKVQADSPLFDTIGREQRRARARGGAFHLSWSVQRRYTSRELAAASVFQLRITAATEQAGEPASPPTAGSGIVLDLRKLPKKDVVMTLPGERLVSQRVAELILDRRLTGVELRRVQHVDNRTDFSIDLNEVPAGRELLALAAAAGYPHPGWSFWVWLNKAEQRALLQAAMDQHVAIARRARRRVYVPPWYHLVVVSNPVSTVLPTHFGIGPFEDDEEGAYVDARSKVAGLNLLSEAYVAEEEWSGGDFVETREKVGAARGLLRPVPLLLVSPRVRELFTEYRVQGVAFEVAHLVSNGVPIWSPN